MAEGGEPRAATAARKARKRTWTQARRRVRWSAGLGLELCERISRGELFYQICREDGMPTPQTVGRWAKEKESFGEALAAAREMGGRHARNGGGVWTYCEETAELVFERLCAGQSLNRIGRDPLMPCVSTLHHWKSHFPKFGEAVRLAKEIQAEAACDQAFEWIEAATPKTAYLTHIKLAHIRWWTGVTAPKTYRAKPAEPEKAPEVRTVLMRHFAVEVNPETGEAEVVAYCPNPITRQLEREDAPGWIQPGDANTFSMPGGRKSGEPKGTAWTPR